MLKAERNFFCSPFFLEVVRAIKIGKATKGTTARKQTKAARQEKQVSKRERLVSKKATNSRERMIMAISEIGYVSLSPFMIIVIF